jgi:endonuclease-3
MGKKEKVKEIIRRLKKEYPKAKIALNFKTPIDLLVATILSAQCTDERVNKVTAHLFKKYKTPADYADADIKLFEQEIRTTGFYRNKAKNIISACKKIVSDYQGKVPQKMEELLKLPGVARKTANIVLANAYDVVVGIPVDTHVRRLSQRLGITQNIDPEKIEQDLLKLVPKNEWKKFPYLLIDHGRAVCNAKKPLCEKCLLKDLCDFYKKERKDKK